MKHMFMVNKRNPSRIRFTESLGKKYQEKRLFQETWDRCEYLIQDFYQENWISKFEDFSVLDESWNSFPTYNESCFEELWDEDFFYLDLLSHEENWNIFYKAQEIL